MQAGYPSNLANPRGPPLPQTALQDDETDQMEVAFTLGFGQFDDPKDLPGLAHLTEHLLLSGPGPDGQQAGRADGE